MTASGTILAFTERSSAYAVEPVASAIAMAAKRDFIIVHACVDLRSWSRKKLLSRISSSVTKSRTYRLGPSSVTFIN